MNKLLIGLLIVAAAAGAFFLLRKKDEPQEAGLKKEWIIGKWKTDATPLNDSNFNRYGYEFHDNGILLRSVNDSVAADTAHYEWNNANELVMKQNASDSTGQRYAILKLTPDSLQVRTRDSSLVLFTKLK